MSCCRHGRGQRATSGGGGKRRRRQPPGAGPGAARIRPSRLPHLSAFFSALRCLALSFLRCAALRCASPLACAAGAPWPAARVAITSCWGRWGSWGGVRGEGLGDADRGCSLQMPTPPAKAQDRGRGVEHSPKGVFCPCGWVPLPAWFATLQNSGQERPIGGRPVAPCSVCTPERGGSAWHVRAIAQTWRQRPSPPRRASHRSWRCSLMCTGQGPTRARWGQAWARGAPRRRPPAAALHPLEGAERPARTPGSAGALPGCGGRRRRRPPPPNQLPPFLPSHALLQVYAQLDKCRAFPDFNNYLAFIFASGEGLPIEVCCRPAHLPCGCRLPPLHSCPAHH